MNIEPLEQRIAPAGIVTVGVAGKIVSITGDGAANDFAIVQVADGSLEIRGSSGTLIQRGDSPAVPTLQMSEKAIEMLGVRVDLGAGADSLAIEDLSVGGKLEIKGGAGNNTVNLAGLMEEEGIFYFLGGADSDTLHMGPGSFSAKSFKADFGGGADFMDYTDDSCMTSFTVEGKMEVLAGGGDDEIRFNALSANVGSLKLDLGAGTNSAEWGDGTGSFGTPGKAEVLGANATAAFNFASLTLGQLVVNLTGGSDAFSMTAAGDLTIRKGTTVSLAADGKVGDITMAAGGTLAMPGVVSMKFGGPTADGAQTHSLNIGAHDARLGAFFCLPEVGDEVLVAFAGYDPATGFDPANPARTLQMAAMNMQFLAGFTANATDSITARGSATLKSAPGAGAAARVVSLTAASVDIGKDLLFTDGAGDADFTLAGDSISIGGKLALNLGDTATHEVVSIGVSGGILSAGSLSFTSAEGRSMSFELFMAGRIETPGALTIVDGTNDADIQFTDVDLDIGKAFTLALGAGDDRVEMSGGTFSSLGFIANLGPGANRLGSSWLAQEVGGKGLDIYGGMDADVVSLDADFGFITALKLNLGAGANNASIESSGGLRIGKLTHLSQSGAAAVLDRLAIEGVVVKEINATFGAADSILKIAACRVGKLTTNLGAGADLMRLDDSVFTGDVAVIAGIGNDDIEVENDETHWVGHDFFLGRVMFDLGAGDDDVIIAGPAPETKATFVGTVTVNGGEGADTFTPHATNAVFAIVPVLTSIP